MSGAVLSLGATRSARQLPKKGGQFDYTGQITRLHRNRQGLTLPFHRSGAMVPPSRCKIFEADRSNPWVLLRYGGGGDAQLGAVFFHRGADACRAIVTSGASERSANARG